MPKSSSAVRPSGSTNRFPPWRSPWKMPWIIAPSMKAIIPVRTTSSVSMPASCMPCHVVELEPRQPLHHQHPPGDEGRVRAGDDVAPLVELGQHGGDVEHVGGLEAEVELLHDGLGEQLHEGRRVGQRGDGDAADEVRCQPGHGPQVLAHESGHLGALDLDDDRLAGPQRGGMDLGDRGRGEGSAVEPGEGGFERGAQVGLHDLAHDGRSVSGVTWSRQSLNSSTSSAGNRPSPEEMIWPSLMYVGSQRLGGQRGGGGTGRPG